MARKHLYRNGTKTPYSFEVLDSIAGELDFVENKLEVNPDVLAWTKNHNIEIPYRDKMGKIRIYIPDFLVRYKSDDRLHLIEVKGAHLIDHKDTLSKQRAGETYCKERNMVYRLEKY